MSVILTILGDIVLGCMFAGKAATRQEKADHISMEHRHGGEGD